LLLSSYQFIFSQFKAIVTRIWAGPKVVSKDGSQEVDIAAAHFQSPPCPFWGPKTLKTDPGGAKN